MENSSWRQLHKTDVTEGKDIDNDNSERVLPHTRPFFSDTKFRPHIKSNNKSKLTFVQTVEQRVEQQI